MCPPTDTESAERKPGRPRDARADALILDAALAEVAEHGWGRTTIDSVATRAKVSKATIYRRWASKERLIFDAIVRSTDPVMEPVDTGSLRGDLIELLGRVMAVIDTKPGCDVLPQLLAAARVDPELRALHERESAQRRAMVHGAFDRAVERGELTAAVDRDAFIDLLAGPVFFRSLFGSARADMTFVVQIVDAALAAVAAGGLRAAP